MRNALEHFTQAIEDAKKIFSLYEQCGDSTIRDDLLRFQIMYSVSALDRFLHDIVRIGIIEIYSQQRVITDKYKSMPFTGDTLMKMLESSSATFIPTSPDQLPENILNKAVADKLGTLAFQSPEKVKDALSYIWNAQNKMADLAVGMQLPGNTINEKQKFLEQKLKSISDRRNQIVHEADFDLVSCQKRNINQQEVSDVINFIVNLTNAIYLKVTDNTCYIVH